MPHPFFGAKDVCYIEKKVAKKKSFSWPSELVVYGSRRYYIEIRGPRGTGKLLLLETDMYTYSTTDYVYIQVLQLQIKKRRLQARRPENSIFLWPAFVTRLLTPRSRKSGYGLFLGCRSGFDGGHDKKNFFYAFPPQKTA